MKKLIIIDEYFVNMVGHYYEYNRSVQEIFADHGIKSVIYANKKLDAGIQKELGAVPYFDGLPKNSLNKLPVFGPLMNRARFWSSLYNKIKGLYQKENEPGTVFFFTTVVWYNVLPIALAARKSKHKNILLYRLSVSEHPGLPASLQKAGTWLYKYTFEKVLPNKNVLFCTDSDVIAAECNEKFDCNMGVLPIPHIKDDGAAPIANGSYESKTNFIVYAPGAIREEKGIEFITRAFEYMAVVKHPILDKITLVTQYNAGGDTGLNADIKGRLEQLPVKNVFLGNLTTEEYNNRLNEADIVLIPYSIDHGYKARTSGIMSETIAACKPFITTKDSWMAIQSEKYNTGLSIPYNDTQQFAEALTELTQHYAMYAEKALQARAGWLAYHSKANFFRLLSGIAGSER